ncbi:hypothetical protein K501DRAFT_322339 [Backusella circina FSU 941]|nr:hypothetical protein K501DRAFT_322339 [Backusella circina FSU 941]
MNNNTFTFLPTPISSPHHSSVGKLQRVPSFTNLPEKRDIDAKKPISTALLIQRILKDLEGRDKSMKTIQYIIKIMLYHNKVAGKSWTNMATQFSITRQMLCLGNAWHDIKELRNEENEWMDILILLNSISNAIADDVYCLCRIGVFPSGIKDRAERISAYCWFIAILTDLRSAYSKVCKLEAEIEAESNKDKMTLRIAKVSLVKLTSDLAFCACDVFQPSFSKGAQAWTGLSSALLSGYKIYMKLSS